jgi:hypothetical protein
MTEPTHTSPQKPVAGEHQNAYTNYTANRKNFLYYEYVDVLVRGLAHDAKSLIDIGSHDIPLIESFDWIADRVTLDIRKPYSSANVRGIQADFFSFVPPKRYDFALCLQVLEHIEDAEAFAQKLLTVADRALVSVPYKWPAGASAYHCQDPVDETKITQWFRRKPDYSLVVMEPLHRRTKARRWIGYFHYPGEPLALNHYRTNAVPRDA